MDAESQAHVLDPGFDSVAQQIEHPAAALYAVMREATGAIPVRSHTMREWIFAGRAIDVAARIPLIGSLSKMDA